MESTSTQDTRDTTVSRPIFDIANDDETDSDSGNGSGKEEEKILIQPGKKSHTSKEFRRISTNCIHPKVPCPTCKGKGKLSQAQSDTMLALIPMHDNRLKPKRTALKLGIAFCFILLTGGLCLAFLFPRKVYLSLDNVSVSGHAVQKAVAVNLTVIAHLNNTNFFAVAVSNISVQALFLSTIDRASHEVGSKQLSSTEHLSLREERQLKILVPTLFTGEDADTIRYFCNWYSIITESPYFYFPIKISITASLKYWTHTEQIETATVKYPQCNHQFQDR